MNRLKLVIDQPPDPSSDQYFQGEISQLNMFSYTVSESDILSMASNCSSPQLMGDLFAWPLAESFAEGQVTVVMPAICGGSQCPPGFTGTYCDREIGTGLIPACWHLHNHAYICSNILTYFDTSITLLHVCVWTHMSTQT